MVPARTAKPCGSGAAMLAPSWRLCSRIAPATVAIKPVHREEHGISRKTIARGMPDCLGVPVVTKSLVLLRFAREATGAD